MGKKKAFTLIELLVVIAIIAILAAVVLVSLGGARARARDARITSDMQQLRNTATIFESVHGTYTGLNGDPDEGTLADDISDQGGVYNIYINNNPPNHVGDEYCAVARLNPDAAGKAFCWCIDSEHLASLKSDNTINTTLGETCDALGPTWNGVANTCVAGCDATGTCSCW